MSSYPEEILMKYREECGWLSKDIKQVVLVSGKREETKYKIECLTMNYTPPNNQAGLFDDAITEASDEATAPYYGESGIRDGESPVEAAERMFKEDEQHERNTPIFTEDEINETDGEN